jgi:hypothetical protein
MVTLIFNLLYFSLFNTVKLQTVSSKVQCYGLFLIYFAALYALFMTQKALSF